MGNSKNYLILSVLSQVVYLDELSRMSFIFIHIENVYGKLSTVYV